MREKVSQMEWELYEPFQRWNKVWFVQRVGTAYSMGVSMTWRWGTVFPRKMNPESRWTLAWQKEQPASLSFSLTLSSSFTFWKALGRFLEITSCPHLFQSNFLSFSLMLYPICLSPVTWSWAKIRVTHPRALHSLQNCPIITPSEKWPLKKTVPTEAYDH